ncbi:Mch5p [Sugiyamaella lignohabitans]|uniref:Mch5p n=1 Tax=Sugiyamaella lignohabitans TaxID=796027 RepID=A0A167E6T1_9ASCO|nr:Mch5p [Sugiyamaella lignohabitans]ANB13715.1 Mch5p [Sugiyamaella lignohabitans]
MSEKKNAESVMKPQCDENYADGGVGVGAQFDIDSQSVRSSGINVEVINNSGDEEKTVGDKPIPEAVPVVGPPPNGGLQAYLAVLGGFFALFNSWGLINTFGAFETYYQEDLLSHEDPSTIAWIGSIQGYFVVAAAIVFGRMVDAGYIQSLLYVGTFLLTFGMMMTSISSEFYQIFLAQGVVVGIGCCCMFVVSVSVVASYFSTRRAFFVGIVASGVSLMVVNDGVREIITRLAG